MPVRCPLGELHLCNELRFQPDAVLHFLPSECPLSSLLFWWVGKQTGFNLQMLQLAPNLTP
jgi:hypothetical protein